MEQTHQSRNPVNLSALLIGEKTVPKGCRVMHVNSHGMLLHCEPDGRPRTFSDGDTIDIHLTVQHEGKQKKLTIPSHVRHVAENSLDVEFHHPDPVLLDLIESYRISDTHRLEATVGDSPGSFDRPEAISTTEAPTPEPMFRTSTPGQDNITEKHRIPVAKLLLALAIIGLASAAFFYGNTLHKRINFLENQLISSNEEISALQTKQFDASLLEGKYASLDSRIVAIGGAVTSLEQQFHADRPADGQPVIGANGQDTVTQTDSLPSTEILPGTHEDSGAAGPEYQKKEAVASIPATDPTGTSPTPDDLEESPQATAAPGPYNEPEKQQPAASGAWAINLLSSDDRRDLERLAGKAESAGIQTLVVETTVKGKRFWRLQVTGFSSLSAAKARATEIQRTLGIEGVWFLKRKPES